jgi:hypothetical protein
VLARPVAFSPGPLMVSLIWSAPLRPRRDGSANRDRWLRILKELFEPDFGCLLYELPFHEGS